MARTVTIVDYRETWPAEFRDLAAALRSAFGPAALRIDHIGSTAVPGLAAKDVIDVQVTVAALADAPAQVAGFEGVPVPRPTIAPPGFAGDRRRARQALLPRAAPDRRLGHVHVREAGRLNQRYAAAVPRLPARGAGGCGGVRGGEAARSRRSSRTTGRPTPTSRIPSSTC